MSIKLLKRLSCGIISGVCCCLFCLLLATAANADVCFLPTGQCEAASANLSTGCSGFNLTGAKDETGWNCTQCGEKWKCEKKSCKDDYKTDVRCSGTETKVCDETRKAGDESCCRCEDSVTKCQHEGYVYKKTSTNENCTGKCPYNSDYYESCECNAKYDKASDANACYTYNTCELGDLAGTKKYEQTNDVHKCKKYMDNAEYVTEDSEQVKGDYDCALVCTETCDNSNRKYYQCSPKGKCKEAEGKYATKELCEASLQHASVFDIFKKYIPNFNYTPNFNLISTSYAAVTDPEQSEEACAHCRYASNYQSCMDACNPQTKIDNQVNNYICPIDQDRNCVACRNSCDRQGYPCCSSLPDVKPFNGCIAMMMNVDMDCVMCKTNDPTWRAEGCEGYPCCVDEPTILCRVNLEKNCAKCDGECDRGSYSCCLDEPQITDCQIDVDRECAKCDGVCTNKIDCCDDVENSPCEKKDGCWVAKQTNVDCTGCEYCIPSTCKDSGEKRIISDSSTYEKCADSCGGKYRCKSGYTPSYVGSNQYKCVRISGCYYDTVAQCKAAGYTYTAEERWWVQDEYMTHECEPCDCGGTEMNKCVPVGGGCESQYKSQCDSWGGTLKSSTSYVTEDVCHAVFGECDNKYWYCLKPGCSDSGSVTVYYDAPTNCNAPMRLTHQSSGVTIMTAATTNNVPAGTYTISPSSGSIQSYTIRMGRGGTPSTKTGTTTYTFSAGNEYWIVPNCSSGGGCQNNSDCNGGAHTACGIRWTACMEMTSNAYSYCMGQAGQSSMMQGACSGMYAANKATCNNYKNYECMICQSGACLPDPVEPNWSSRLQHYSN